MSEKEKILRTLESNIESLRKTFPVKRLGLFGSLVRGEEKLGSDADILVELDLSKRMNIIDYLTLQERLSEIIGKKVDLVSLTGIKKDFIRSNILNEVIFIDG